MNKKNQSNSTSATNNKYSIPSRVFVPDSEDGESNDIEIVQKQKKKSKKAKK